MVSQREKMRTSANIRRWSANCRLSSMLILYMPLLCSFYAYCEARDTMRSGEWIIDNGETLVSAGGKFEFGFFSPTGSSGNKRYVGIWYHEWDDNRTVVWVANRNFPIINAIGVFNVTEELGLKVLDTTGKEYWSADIGSNPFHVGLLAFTEFLKLQPPAVFQQGFDCFSAGYSLAGSDFLTLSLFSRTLLCNEI